MNAKRIINFSPVISMMEWPPEMYSTIRDLYYEWECGSISYSSLCDELVRVGLRLGPSFPRTLEQHDNTRGLSFGIFMRSLKRSIGEVSNTAPVTINDLNAEVTPRQMHAFLNRDISLSSSAKAPFGTDNNAYIRGISQSRSENKRLVSAIVGSVESKHRTFAQVPGAKNLFEQSPRSCNCMEKNLIQPREIAPHLRPTIDPITGEDFSPDRVKIVSEAFSRRISENSTHIEASATGLTPGASSVVPDAQRRHFGQSNKETIEPYGEQVAPSNVSSARSLNNILAYDEGTPIEEYRPLSRISVSKSLPPCPFATDKDDLKAMRQELHNTPLGKPLFANNKTVIPHLDIPSH